MQIRTQGNAVESGLAPHNHHITWIQTVLVQDFPFHAINLRLRVSATVHEPLAKEGGRAGRLVAPLVDGREAAACPSREGRPVPPMHVVDGVVWYTKAHCLYNLFSAP